MPKSEKMVKVQVAPRRSIQVGTLSRELGSRDTRRIVTYPDFVEVPESELPRLLKLGFIVDPSPKKLPSGAEDVDMSAYLNSSDQPAPDLKMGGRPIGVKENAPAAA